MDAQKKSLEIAKSRRKVSENQLKLQQQIGNLAGGRGAVQTETQTFEIQQAAAKAKVISAQMDLELAQARFKLEQEMLAIQMRKDKFSEAEIERVKSASQAIFDLVERRGNAAIDGAKAELSILRISRAVSASSAVGVDKAGQQIEKVARAVEKLQSRAKSELNTNTGELSLQRKALLKEIKENNLALADAANQDPFLADITAGTTERLERDAELLRGKLIDTTFAIKQAAVSLVAEAFTPFIDELLKLGPEGEVVAAVAQGAVLFAESWIGATQAISQAFGVLEEDGGIKIENIGKKFKEMATADKIDLLMAGATAAVQSLNAINSILDAQSRKSVKQVQQQIDIEKKRDGKSAESLARLKELDKKKESMERKAFERNKKIAIANALISTASGMIGVFRGLEGLTQFPLAAIAAGAIGVLGAAQVALIASQSYQGGGGSPSSGMPSSIGAGERRSSVDLARSQSARGEIAYFRGAQGQGGPENFTPAFAGARYRATGGETAGYVVGEQGPELFVPQTPGRVVSNDDVGEMSGTANVNFSINAIDAAGVEEVLVSQRGNIIGMIREAANSYGQEFVEGVDTSVYTPSAGGVSKY